MNNLRIFIYFYTSFFLVFCEDYVYNIDTFLEWGLKNNLKLSSLIETSKLVKNKIKFIAKIDIDKDKELMKIPFTLMLNLSKTLELINLKDLNKQFKEFHRLNITYKPDKIDFRKEESFLSYILYLVNHKPKKYKKTKFFEIYEKYLETLKKYYPKSPLFFPPRQIEYLAGSFLDKSIDDIKKIYQDEINIYSNKTYFKKELDFDEYVHYRLAINKYGLNISNHWTLVPFLNYFEDNYNQYNANYTIEKDGIKIFSNKEIKKGEEIILASPKKTNIISYIMEGKTNEKLVDYFTEYSISAFSPGLYYQYGINDKKYFTDYYVNIMEKDFDLQLTKIYKDNAEMLNGDGSDVWAYDITEMNINVYKEHFESITLDKIYDIYYDTDDRINIERIIRGERKIIIEADDKINKILDKLIEEENKMKRKKRQQRENNSEL